ncbi:MAG: PEP/pyruvate-binding domain-containing protein, partial [Candidatus Nanoarchaeia archaeon]|nr:PEP/pyruvate-binding domain-containing protein [Candidatus Nanoarchaeia archaeon]
MGNILWFNDIKKDNIDKVGGKGANLGEMYNSDIPVPPGFCVTVEAYQTFLEDTGLDMDIYPILDDLDVNDTAKLHDASEKIQDMIIDAEMPAKIKNDILNAYDNMNINIDVFKSANKKALDMIKAGRDLPFVAVRSSATAEDLPTASFAGQQATFLNIRGTDSLIDAVKKCWASLFTARAIFYRIEKGFEHSKVFISVVVQKMVRADKAGVVFTINPSTNNENEIVIEAGFGLGEAVVSGAITPDTYIINKETFEIKEKKIGKQEFKIILDVNLKRNVRRTLDINEASVQKMSDGEIIKLAQLSKMIEVHYEGKPQDIE